MPTDQFYTHLDTVIEQSRMQGVAASVPGVVPRPWNIPTTYPVGGLIDVEDPAFFKIACDRTDLNALAIAAYETGHEVNAGRLGHVMAAKKAMDYQAAYERALQARHASAVRRRVWAMARRTGHGSPTYGVFGVVRNELDAIMDNSTSAQNSPVGSQA